MLTVTLSLIIIAFFEWEYLDAKHREDWLKDHKYDEKTGTIELRGERRRIRFPGDNQKDTPDEAEIYKRFYEILKKKKESSKTVQDMLDVCALIVADPPFINLSSTYMNMKNGKPKEAIIEHEETHLRNHSLNPIYIDENSALSGDALRTMLRVWTKKDKKQREIVNKLIDKYNKDIKDKNSPTYKRWKNRKVLEDYTDITNMNYHQNIDEFEADIGAALKTSKRALLKGVKYLSKKSLQDGYIKNLREVNMLLILLVTGQANIKLQSGANTFAALLQMRANLKHAIKTARGFTKTELKARKRAMNEWKVDKSLYEEAIRNDYYREYDIQDYVDAIECDNLSNLE